MRFLPLYLLAGIALAACGGNVPGARTDVVRATDDGFRQYSALRAAGYNYKIAGQVSAITVSRTPGDTSHLSLVPGPAGLTVSLVRSPKRIVELTLDRGNARSASSQVVGCTDDCNSGGGATPSPRATPPPNYSACTGIGGATFFDDDAGSGGCLSAGQTKSWSCGSWTWSSRGKGHYRSWDGLVDVNDISYVTVSDNGSNCHIGW